MTDLSIVIISWNTREMTRACLASVYEGHAGLSIQTIVVDNGSSDGSFEMVAREFPQVELVRNISNRGFARANNQAFPLAKSDFVLLLNSDTIALGGVIARSVEYMRSNPRVGAMGCRILNTDRTLQRTCSREPSCLNLVLMLMTLDKLPWPRWCGRYQYRHWDRRDERPVDVVSGCFLLTRRAILEQVGHFDEQFFFFGEETDWCMRVRRAGWLCMLAPVGEIVHHGGGSAKKLNHMRDIMLADATVRLHRKHGSRLTGAIVGGLLALFVLSRYVGYSLASMISNRAHIEERRRHFRDIIRYFLDRGAGKQASVSSGASGA